MIKNLKLKFSHTVGVRTEIDDVTTIPLLIQRFYGHQVLDPNWSWKKYLIHFVFFFSVLIYVAIGTFVVLKDPEVTINMIAEGSYTILETVLDNLKLMIFISKRKELQKLYLLTKTSIHSMMKEEMKDKVKGRLNRIKKMVIIFCSMVAAPVVMYEFVTSWNYLKGDRKWMSRTSDILMPMTSPYFEIGWILHSFFMTYIAALVMIMDIWFAFFSSFYGFGCDCLFQLLIVEGKRSTEDENAYADRLSCALKKFYNNHIIIVEYLRILNDIYKWMAIVPLANAAFSICIILMVLVEGINLKFAPQILPILAAVFVFSYYGEHVKKKTDQINDGLLNFDWTNMKMRDRKSYLIIFLFMNRTVGVKTAIGHNLSLTTMTMVVKFSYQAFTVLQTMN